MSEDMQMLKKDREVNAIDAEQLRTRLSIAHEIKHETLVNTLKGVACAVVMIVGMGLFIFGLIVWVTR